MNSISLSNATIKRLVSSPDATAERALDALQRGKMTISYTISDKGTVSATIQSVKWVGKKSPRCEEHYYIAQVHDRGFDCSCPAFQYDKYHQACKHLMALAFLLEGEQDEQKQAA